MNNFLVKRSILIVGVSYVILLIFYFSTFNLNLSSDNAKWGTFGDFLGGSLSPIIGILSIVLTYNIIRHQTVEDKQSEFRYLFQILFDSLEENKSVINFNKFNKSYSGREAIKYINKSIESLHLSNIKKGQGKSFDEIFWSVYEDIDRSSATYMKNLHNCLKIIDNNCAYERQEIYSSLLRAQINEEEMKFILYNGLASTDFENMKSRIEKFTLLKDIAKDITIEESLKNLYAKSAFQENSLKYKTIALYKKNWGFDIKFNFRSN